MSTTHNPTFYPASRRLWLGPLVVTLIVGLGLTWVADMIGGGPWLAWRLLGMAGGCLAGAVAASRHTWRLAGFLLLTGQGLAIFTLLLFLLT